MIEAPDSPPPTREVAIVGLALPTTTFSFAALQAPVTELLLASPLYVARQRYVPAWVVVKAAEVAVPPLSGRFGLVKIAALAQVASSGP